MFRFLTGGPAATGPTFESLEQEVDAVKYALAAGPLILGDEYDRADEHLLKQDSPFSKLGLSVVALLRAVLGNEAEMQKAALSRLADLEAAATDLKNRSAISEPFKSDIYPVGSQYALCLAHCYIMTVVINFLSGNMLATARGLLKARQAYIILQELAACEQRYLDNYRTQNGLDALHLSKAKDVDGKARDEQEAAEAQLFDHPIDSFVRSGANLCCGIMQILVSLIPPTMAKMISVIGFRGDRVAGLDMLWRASSTADIHGALASLFLLDYHVNLASICDMYGPADFPVHRLENLLADMERLYPKMRLMDLEAGRMLIVQSRIADAVAFMTETPASRVKQIESQVMFQTSIQCMSLHRYQQCADNFLKCTDLNSWSHSMYYYCSGCSYAEMYRVAIRNAGDDATKITEAQKLADKAAELLRMAPPKTGKKRLMTRKLPLDVFVSRKMNKWETRAKARNIPLVEAIGTAPLEEMNYIWMHALKFMSSADLKASLDRLAEEEEEQIWAAKEADEQAIHHLLKAKMFMHTEKLAEAKEIIVSKLLTKTTADFSGPDAETWILPNAHYEMAVIAWKEAGGSAGRPIANRTTGDGASKASDEVRKAKLAECSSYIDKVSKWKEDWDFAGGVHMGCRIARRTLDGLGVQ